jgi:hypothetical protein
VTKLRDIHNAIYANWVKHQPVAPVTPNPVALAGTVPKEDRYRNTWERQFGQHLELRKRAGDIRQYEFEALRFRLADDATYLPDFVVWLPDDVVQVIEIKGRKREAGILRFRIARSKYPHYVWRMVKKQAGRWEDMKV